MLELARELDADEGEPPDAAAELADAVSALRLATAGAIAAGPVVFERLDFRPLRISPLLPIAATQPRGEAIRLDRARGALAADLRERLPLADDDRELGEALDRWELSLFADEPFRSGQVREALDVPARRRRRRVGRFDARGGAARREDGDPRRSCSTRSAPSGSGATRATRCGGRSSRRSRTAIARRSSRRSTRRCSGCGRGRRPSCASPERFARSFHTAGTDTSHLPRYRRVMDEAEQIHEPERVLSRLRRIDELRAGGSAGDLLDELRELVPEAEEWARSDGDERARAAAARLREEAKRMR